jgi:hypothetical protein
VTGTEVMDGYRARSTSLTAFIHLANSAKIWRFRMYGRLYLCDALLDQLAQDLEAMTAELGQCVQEEHAIVGQGHFARQGHMAAPD